MARRPHRWGVTQTAAQLGCSAETVRNLFDSGQLTGTRTPGGHRRIDPASVHRLNFPGVSETARELGRSGDTIRAWFDAGILRGYRTPAGHRRIDPDSIDQLHR